MHQPRRDQQSASMLCDELGLSAAAAQLAAEGDSPEPFLRKLRQSGLLADALRLMPHLLPKRRAVWWGCLCAWRQHRQPGTDAATAALEAAVQWVQHPSEDHRRRCEAAGRAAGMTSSAGCVAMAAFWATGSMSRPNLPEVRPPSSLTARLIGGALLLAAAEREPLKLYEHYEEFLSIGEQVARGELLWNTPGNRDVRGADRRYRLDSAGSAQPPHWVHSAVFAAMANDDVLDHYCQAGE